MNTIVNHCVRIAPHTVSPDRVDTAATAAAEAISQQPAPLRAACLNDLIDGLQVGRAVRMVADDYELDDFDIAECEAMLYSEIAESEEA